MPSSYHSTSFYSLKWIRLGTKDYEAMGVNPIKLLDVAGTAENLEWKPLESIWTWWSNWSCFQKQHRPNDWSFGRLLQPLISEVWGSTCFERASRKLMPKKRKVTCLKYNRSVAQMSVVIKCFERFAIATINYVNKKLDLLQFSYRQKYINRVGMPSHWLFSLTGPFGQ